MRSGTERVVATFLELAPLHGPSRAEEPVAVVVRTKLEEMGLSWWEDDAAKQFGGTTGNIIADIPPSPGVTDPRLRLGAVTAYWPSAY